MAEVDAELQAAGKLQMLEQPQHIAAREAAKVEGGTSVYPSTPFDCSLSSADERETQMQM